MRLTGHYSILFFPPHDYDCWPTSRNMTQHLRLGLWETGSQKPHTSCGWGGCFPIPVTSPAVFVILTYAPSVRMLLHLCTVLKSWLVEMPGGPSCLTWDTQRFLQRLPSFWLASPTWSCLTSSHLWNTLWTKPWRSIVLDVARFYYQLSMGQTHALVVPGILAGWLLVLILNHYQNHDHSQWPFLTVHSQWPWAFSMTTGIATSIVNSNGHD